MLQILQPMGKVTAARQRQATMIPATLKNSLAHPLLVEEG
jgi:hypothetical protein